MLPDEDGGGGGGGGKRRGAPKGSTFGSTGAGLGIGETSSHGDAARGAGAEKVSSHGEAPKRRGAAKRRARGAPYRSAPNTSGCSGWTKITFWGVTSGGGGGGSLHSLVHPAAQKPKTSRTRAAAKDRKEIVLRMVGCFPFRGDYRDSAMVRFTIAMLSLNASASAGERFGSLFT